MSEQIKVALIIGKCCPGGIVSYAIGYASRLVKYGFEFDFYIDENPDSKCYSDLKNIGNVYEMPPVKDIVRYYRAYLAAFKNNHCDIVHGLLNTLNPISMQAARSANISVRLSENLSTGHPSESKSIIKEMIKPFAKLGSTAIAANSKLAANWIYGDKGADKAIIINNPVDTAKFHLDSNLREETRARLGWDDEFIIGCVARFEPQKNHQKLIQVYDEVLKLHSNSKLVLMGFGHLEDSIKQKINDLQLSKKVEFLDPHFDLCAFYNAIDLFALTSLYEGLPMVVIEAQATGLACVLSSEITKECAVNDNVVFVDLNSPDDCWADAVIELKNRACDRGKLSLNIKQSIYDADVAAEKLATQYVSLFENKL